MHQSDESPLSGFRRLFEEERLHTAGRVLAVRAVVVPIYLGLNVYFGFVAGNPGPLGRIPNLAAYAVFSVALFIAARFWPAVRRNSWLALPFLDLPFIFLLQFYAIIRAPEGGKVVSTFTLSLFLLILIASQLSLRRRNLLAAALVAAVFETALLTHSETSYVMFDAILILFAATAMARYLADRNLPCCGARSGNEAWSTASAVTSRLRC